MVLGRRLLGVFMTVYMPTILMNIIGHSTLYFKPFFFEAQVSVNLTVMLVLTTMFVSVSNELPRTSYIKMVDIWLVFNLLIPFVEVLLHTYKVASSLTLTPARTTCRPRTGRSTTTAPRSGGTVQPPRRRMKRGLTLFM